MQKLNNKGIKKYQANDMTRRDFLNLSGKLGLATTFSPLFFQSVEAMSADQSGIKLYNANDKKSLDWMAEARIGGLSVSSEPDHHKLKIELARLIKQGVSVVQADSRLSDYLSEHEYRKEMQHIKAVTETIHQHGLKVVWYIPSLEVITVNGVTRKDSFARTHPDWLQVSYDGEDRGVFYGQKVFWVEKTDESAWLCPNSPFREWFKNNLQLLAATGVDGIWLDVPIFDEIVVKFGCSCQYCREKFTAQTSLPFPDKFDISDQNFWQFVRWRHRTITEFLDDCKAVIEQVNADVVTIAEIVALDHTGATQLGSEGSDLENILIVWEVDSVSETTGMAEGSYDDWIALHTIYKYCRGATMDRPSWAFSYGYAEADAQLVIASTIASQNNPYELRTPLMGSSVGAEFRQLQFDWIKQYSKQIFRSRSLATVAILYSERNRDFLDMTELGGVCVSSSFPWRDRGWLVGPVNFSAIELEYLGDYRGLSILMYQNQIPTDIYPISRVNSELLQHYSVLVLPSMVSLSEMEKNMLMAAVRNGTTLIVTGEEAGSRDENTVRRAQSLWADIINETEGELVSKSYGKGKIHFWKQNLGQQYLKTKDDELIYQMLSLVLEAGVESWVSKKLPVVVQPYIYQQQIVIHVLNYSWVGALENQPNKLNIELNIPWTFDSLPVRITQTEPQQEKEKRLTFSKQGDKIIIPIEIAINAIILIDLV